MSAASASLLTWMMRFLVAAALLAFVATCGMRAEAAPTSASIETTQEAALSAYGDAAKSVANPIAADDVSPIDVLPVAGFLFAPTRSRSVRAANDDPIRPGDSIGFDRPPRARSGHRDA